MRGPLVVGGVLLVAFLSAAVVAQTPPPPRPEPPRTPGGGIGSGAGGRMGTGSIGGLLNPVVYIDGIGTAPPEPRLQCGPAARERTGWYGTTLMFSYGDTRGPAAPTARPSGIGSSSGSGVVPSGSGSWTVRILVASTSGGPPTTATYLFSGRVARGSLNGNAFTILGATTYAGGCNVPSESRTTSLDVTISGTCGRGQPISFVARQRGVDWASGEYVGDVNCSRSALGAVNTSYDRHEVPLR